jgi:AcrR family transcriptional regulator
MSETVVPIGRTDAPARQRVLDSAYRLFSRRSVQSVAMDEIAAEAGVANDAALEQFGTKDDLVLAFLAQREQLWTLGFVELEARRRGFSPEERLLAIFDVFDEWFRREDFEACSFINVLLELGADHPAGKACIDYLDNIRTVVRTLADEAGLRDTESFARSWHILMKGSIVSAVEGDVEAAQRAKSMAALLIRQHRA